MSSVKVEKVTEPVQFGEGPHWDDEQQVLYYVDIKSRKALKYDPATGSQASVVLDDEPHFILPVKGTTDKFLVSGRTNIILITWDGKSATPQSKEVIVTVDKDQPENNVNDAKADASGRLWSGTMGPVKDGVVAHEKGTMFSLNKTRSVDVHLTKVSLSNGLTWSPDNKTMYYIDSPTRQVDAFDFDLASGKISNRRKAFSFAENGVDGGPDGMTVDTDGNLWVACFDGRKVIKVDPKSGKLLSHVDIPAFSTTSVTWGGRELDELFVTTGCFQPSASNPPDTGAVFRVTGLGARGLPNQKVRL